MGISSDGDKPIRWVFVGWFNVPAKSPIAVRIPAERAEAWCRDGWTVIVRERDVIEADLDDVRREDERGRR